VKLFQSISRALSAGRLLNLHAHAYWGYCPECLEATPWFTNAWSGESRCTRCDRNQLDETAD
jgi:hypothetical protein